jgi:hypothetical protein
MKLAKTLAIALFACVALSIARADEPLFPPDDVPLEGIARALREKRPLSLKPVGTSSLVFKMDLDGGIDAAWKPRTKTHPAGHLAEVAAFRIGRALGMNNVAPAVPRSLGLDQIRALLGNDGAARFAELSPELVAEGQEVSGAAIYWIPDMHETGLDSKEGTVRWSRYLAQDGDPPSRDKSKSIAADVSTMLCLDYLIGNWDRMSGANVQGDHDGRRLFVRDHNLAFYEPLPRVQHERVLGRLRKVERFSQSFVSALKALDRAQLTRALTAEGDPRGFQLLDEKQVAAVLDRRLALLSYIAAVIDRYGERAVLSFP